MANCLCGMHKAQVHSGHPINRVWQCTPVIPECGERRQEDKKFNAILCYKFGMIQGYMRDCLTKEKKKLKHSRNILLMIKGD